ncbi:MAG: glycosyltransferase family 4 protein [Clostridiales bacterium]|nr:glycosyltransferase family 4 protein [Clostridiales bacterium]
MKIAVDCRYLGRSGIGRVCQGLIDNLDYNKDEFYLIGRVEKLKEYKGAKIIEDNSNPYSKKGMIAFNKSVNKICEALIIPNFIIPFGVKIPVYSVMHDLIFLDEKLSCRNSFDRFIKKAMLYRCVKKSRQIACVSYFTKGRVAHHFKKYKNKCFVNYIGLSNSVLSYKNNKKITKSKNTLLFVGNVKPHKGIKTLISAFKKLPKNSFELKIIGKKENFLVNEDFSNLNLNGVIFTGELSDDLLLDEIYKATFLIQPSIYEGFGLPPLEALYLGTKPIISDIQVFKEIYASLPVAYFFDADDLAQKILKEPSKIREVKGEIKKRYCYCNFAKNIIQRVKNDT